MVGWVGWLDGFVGWLDCWPVGRMGGLVGWLVGWSDGWVCVLLAWLVGWMGWLLGLRTAVRAPGGPYCVLQYGPRAARTAYCAVRAPGAAAPAGRLSRPGCPHAVACSDHGNQKHGLCGLMDKALLMRPCPCAHALDGCWCVCAMRLYRYVHRMRINLRKYTHETNMSVHIYTCVQIKKQHINPCKYTHETNMSVHIYTCVQIKKQHIHIYIYVYIYMLSRIILILIFIYLW